MIALWTLCPGDVSAEYASSVFNLLRHDRTVTPRIRVSGPILSAARSDVVVEFLRAQTHADWLLFVDADTGFPPDLVDRLLAVADEHRAQLVGAVCPVIDHGNRTGAPNCFVERDGKMVRSTDLQEVQEVAAIGAGVLMAHRRVLQEMLEAPGIGPRWFHEIDVNGNHYGEDVGFCVRVRELGHKVVAVKVPDVVHVKRRLLRLA